MFLIATCYRYKKSLMFMLWVLDNKNPRVFLFRTGCLMDLGILRLRGNSPPHPRGNRSKKETKGPSKIQESIWKEGMLVDAIRSENRVNS